MYLQTAVIFLSEFILLGLKKKKKYTLVISSGRFIFYLIGYFCMCMVFFSALLILGIHSISQLWMTGILHGIISDITHFLCPNQKQTLWKKIFHKIYFELQQNNIVTPVHTVILNSIEISSTEWSR